MKNFASIKDFLDKSDREFVLNRYKEQTGRKVTDRQLYYVLAGVHKNMRLLEIVYEVVKPRIKVFQQALNPVKL